MEKTPGKKKKKLIKLKQEHTLLNDLRRKIISETKIAKKLLFDSIDTGWFISHNVFFDWGVPPPLDRVTKI